MTTALSSSTSTSPAPKHHENFPATLRAAPEADAAWATITKLRQGPGQPDSESPEKIVQAARSHLAAQEKVLAAFLQQFPDDPRRFEAELEYTSVVSTLGASLSDRKRIEKSLQRLAALERSKSAPLRYRADAAFQRITITMQTVNIAASARPGETAMARNTILESAQNFAGNFPDDRRAARLLVQGRDFSLAAQKGRVVALVFWAGWSPPSVAWLAEFAKFSRSLPQGVLSVATVSLDTKEANCTKTLEALALSSWPTAYSGSGWDDPLARRLGINALPTVFVFDKAGRLRSLNARRDYEPLIRQLLAEETSSR